MINAVAPPFTLDPKPMTIAGHGRGMASLSPLGENRGRRTGDDEGRRTPH